MDELETVYNLFFYKKKQNVLKYLKCFPATSKGRCNLIK